jgi:hypothetical protein
MKTRILVCLAVLISGMLVRSSEVPACLVTCPMGDDALTSAAPGTRDLDILDDGLVGLGDFAAFGVAYRGPFDMCWDLNCDGVMSLADLAIFGAHWLHAGAAPATVCAPI